MINKISGLTVNKNKVQYPLNIIKGTKQERFQLAKDYTEKFFNKLLEQPEMLDFTLPVFKKTLKETAGEGIRICVYESFDTYPSGSQLMNLYSKNCERNGYVFLFNTKDRNLSVTHKILRLNVRKYMEPVVEFFNLLVNPKYGARAMKMGAAEAKFMREFTNPKNPLDKSGLNKILLGKTMQEKIDTLQYLRYSLENENIKHEQGHKYVRKVAEYVNKKVPGLYVREAAENVNQKFPGLNISIRDEVKSDGSYRDKMSALEKELMRHLTKARKVSKKG